MPVPQPQRLTLDEDCLSLNEAAHYLAVRRGLSGDEAKVILERALRDHCLPLFSRRHGVELFCEDCEVSLAVDLEDAEIRWENSEVRRRPTPPRVRLANCSNEVLLAAQRRGISSNKIAAALSVSRLRVEQFLVSDLSGPGVYSNVFVKKKSLTDWIELNSPASDRRSLGPAMQAPAEGRMTLRPTSRWTWQQACAFWVWLDPRMVELVAPKDGDVYKVFTVDELLADQKKARWRSGYIYPRSRQPRPSWPQYPLGLTPDQFPEPIGSIAAFERAVANGLVVESEFGTFGPAEVMDVTQTAERAAHAAVPTSDTDPQKAEPVTTLEPAMRNNAGDTTDGPDRETSAEVAGSGIDERARSSPNAPVVDAVPVNGDEAKIDETATVQRLAEWIFLQRVRLKERDKLYEVARQNDQLGVFRKSDFLAAYQLVYVSKAHRPPASGWLLQPAYKKRAEEDKNSAVAKVQKGLKDF